MATYLPRQYAYAAYLHLCELLTFPNKNLDFVAIITAASESKVKTYAI